MTTSRADHFTNSEADAAWFEAGHAPTRLEAAIEAGYDPADDTTSPPASDEVRDMVARAAARARARRGEGL